MIDITNYMNTPPEADFDLDLRQSEVDGGVISYEQIDTINDYPDAKSIVISGLKQDTFSYFIQKYGNRFEAIK